MILNNLNNHIWTIQDVSRRLRYKFGYVPDFLAAFIQNERV